MTADYEMVLADHFHVEDLAITIEVLASQLERIRTAVAPLLEDPSQAGDLARTVHVDVYAPDPDDAAKVVRASFDEDLTGVLNYGAERIFGHPDLVLVSHLTIDFKSLSNTYHRHLVHTPSGRVFEVSEKDTVEDAAAAAEMDLAGA